MKKDNHNNVQFTDSEKEACMPTIKKILHFSALSRRSGFLVLVDEMETEQDNFLKAAVKMLTDAAEPELIENVLRMKIEKDKPSGAEHLNRLLILQGALLLSDGKPTRNVALNLTALLGEEYAARINDLVPAEREANEPAHRR